MDEHLEKLEIQTYRDLRDRLNGLSEEQLDQEVRVMTYSEWLVQLNNPDMELYLERGFAFGSIRDLEMEVVYEDKSQIIIVSE